jgi:hypothetical protein
LHPRWPEHCAYTSVNSPVPSKANKKRDISSSPASHKRVELLPDPAGALPDTLAPGSVVGAPRSRQARPGVLGPPCFPLPLRPAVAALRVVVGKILATSTTRATSHSLLLMPKRNCRSMALRAASVPSFFSARLTPPGGAHTAICLSVKQTHLAMLLYNQMIFCST